MEHIDACGRDSEVEGIGGGGLAGNAAAHNVVQADVAAFDPVDSNVLSIGQDGDALTLGLVYADGVVEDGLEGDVAVHKDGAFRVGVAVAPFAERKAREGTCQQGGMLAKVVGARTIDGSHLGVVGCGVDGEGLQGKDGRVGGVVEHSDRAGIVAIAVTPIFEDVVLRGGGGDGDFLSGLIGAGACDGAHGDVVAVDGDGVGGIGLEEGDDVAVACDVDDTGIGSDAVVPTGEVVVWSGDGLYGDLRTVFVDAGADGGALEGVRREDGNLIDVGEEDGEEGRVGGDDDRTWVLDHEEK